jgi:tetratricopeptide (TPR) repeat protein
MTSWIRAMQDRTPRSYVYGEMAIRPERGGRLVARLALVASLALAAACGGSDKKVNNPGSGTGSGSGSGSGSSDPSMNDGDPDSPDGTPGGSGGSSGGGTGSPGDGGTGTDPEEEKPPPPVIPPNYDPDPAQARGTINQHLQRGRAALAAAPTDPETALREARLALAVDGSNIEAAALVAHAYVLKKQYDTAELVLDDLFKRESAKRNPRVLYVYGLVYEKTKRPAEAALAFRQAAELDPSLASAQVNLGVAQLRNKQYDEAAVTFERLVNSGRTDAITYTSLGSAYRGRSAEYPVGSPDQAQWLSRGEEAYKRAVSANRNYGPAYYNLGLLYMDADPFPDPSTGAAMDTLVRLGRAKTYFDEYKNMPGVDIKLYEERMKDVQKAIKREEKRRSKKK